MEAIELRKKIRGGVGRRAQRAGGMRLLPLMRRLVRLLELQVVHGVVGVIQRARWRRSTPENRAEREDQNQLHHFQANKL